MKFFLDSADEGELAPLMKTGVFAGVTTNPVLLEKSGVSRASVPDFARRLLELGAQEGFLQATGAESAAMEDCARKLAGLDARVIVKLPCDEAGYSVAARLIQSGVRVCMTAAYEPHQALMADAVGADYVAPYLGRMNDAGRDGLGVIARMAEGLSKTRARTQILAASLRHIDDIAALAACGATCVTLSPKVARALFDVAQTEAAVRDFQQAADRMAL